jgi:hypothetical protein
MGVGGVQIEGLVVGKNLALGDLMGMIQVPAWKRKRNRQREAGFSIFYVWLIESTHHEPARNAHADMHMRSAGLLREAGAARDPVQAHVQPLHGAVDGDLPLAPR